MKKTIFIDPPVSWSHNAPQNAAEWEELADWMKAHPGERVCLGEYLVEDVPQLAFWFVGLFDINWVVTDHNLEDDSKCLVVAHYENSNNLQKRETKNE